MRFKVFMINNQGNLHDETVFVNNEKEAKMNLLEFNPNSKLLEAEYVYN